MTRAVIVPSVFPSFVAQTGTRSAAVAGIGFVAETVVTTNLVVGSALLGVLTVSVSAQQEDRASGSNTILSLTPPQQWSTTHRFTGGPGGATIDLFNNNLKAIEDVAADDSSVYAATTSTAGKFYWELFVSTSDVTQIAAGLGNINAGWFTTQWVGSDANAAGWVLAQGDVSVNQINISTAWPIVAASGAIATTICFAVDLNNHLMWGRVGNGTWAGSTASGDPATGSNGLAIPSTVYAAAMSPGCTLSNVGDYCIAKFDPSTWLFSAPSGFNSWNTITPIGQAALLPVTTGHATILALGSSGSLSQTDFASGKTSVEILASAASLSQTDYASGNSSIIFNVSASTSETDYAVGSSVITLTASASLLQTDYASGGAQIEVLTGGAQAYDWWFTGSGQLEVLNASGQLQQYDLATAVASIEVIRTAVTAYDWWFTGSGLVEALTASAQAQQVDLASGIGLIEVINAVGTVYDTSFTGSGLINVLNAAGQLQQYDLASASNSIELITAKGTVLGSGVSGVASIEILAAAGQLLQTAPASGSVSIEVISAAGAAYDWWFTGSGLVDVLTTAGQLQQVDLAIGSASIEILAASAAAFDWQTSGAGTIAFGASGSLLQTAPATAATSVEFLTCSASLGLTAPAQGTGTIEVLHASGTLAANAFAGLGSCLVLSCHATAANLGVSGQAQILPISASGAAGLTVPLTGSVGYLLSASGQLAQTAPAAGKASIELLASSGLLSLQQAFAGGGALSVLGGVGVLNQFNFFIGNASINFSAEGSLKPFSKGLHRQVWFDHDDRYIYWPPRKPSVNISYRRVSSGP